MKVFGSMASTDYTDFRFDAHTDQVQITPLLIRPLPNLNNLRIERYFPVTKTQCRGVYPFER
jgi:hypothetical protein